MNPFSLKGVVYSPVPLTPHRESEPGLHEQHWFWIGLNRRDPTGDQSWRWSDGLGVSPGGIWVVKGANLVLVEMPNTAHLSQPPSSSITTLTAVTMMTMTSGAAQCWIWPPCSGCRCSVKPSWTGSANYPKVLAKGSPNSSAVTDLEELGLWVVESLGRGRVVSNSGTRRAALTSGGI